jgi:3-phosphoshikimate 1-carboxyvinyltransferase
MKSVKINPMTLEGEINIPPSKSMSHRAIICASLSRGESLIHNISYSDDIIATIEGMKALGVEVLEEILDQDTGTYSLRIKGVEEFKLQSDSVNCKESGSTIRFLIPILMLAGEKFKITGEGRLVERPLDTYYRIFEQQGIEYANTGGILPLEIEGCLKPDTFSIEGNISSQFITGLLFTLPLLDGDSRIVVTESELESKGYVDLTIDILRKFGIEIENRDYKEFFIKGNQSYVSREYKVEGDYSQGAFWIVAGLLDGKIVCKDLEKSSLQGDKEVVEIVERMGGKISVAEDSITVEKSETRGTVIDASQCPDIIPVLSVLAALSEGETRVINGKRLRIKESDRITSTRTELEKLGADIREEGDGLVIVGKPMLEGGVVLDSWNDHRIAMAMGVASIRCKEPVEITNSGSVSKSYPHFWEDFKKLGGAVDERNMG